MSAEKIIALAEEKQLIEANVAAQLRKQVTSAKAPIRPETIVKFLVDKGLITAVQAKRLLAAVEERPPAAAATVPPPAKSAGDELGFAETPEEKPAASPKPAPQPAPPAAKPAPPKPMAAKPPAKLTPQPPAKPKPTQDVGFADDEEIVDLDPVESAEVVEVEIVDVIQELQPLAPVAKPTAPPPKPVAELQPLTPLQPLAPAGQPQPQPRPQPQAPLAPLTPLSGGMNSPPAPLGSDGLQPLGGGADLFGGPAPLAGDPFGAPLGGDGFGAAVAPPQSAPQQNAGPVIPDKIAAAGWDSPLLLFGSGALGLILILFVLLLLWMTRGNAAEVFAKAEEQYRAGSYSAAIEAYNSFLKSYGTDPKASLARVHKHMSYVRQVADAGTNPQQALKLAQEELPPILPEEAFAEARNELANILPDIADELVNQAKAASDTNRREELVKLVEQALELVNNPSYIPSSLRTGQQGKIDSIGEKLIAARRSIDQDRESLASLERMRTAAAEGKALAGYQERAKLLARFPGFETNPALIEATAAISAKERDLVQTTAVETLAATDDPAANQVQKIPAGPEGADAPVPADHVAAVLIKGAVYGISVKTGKPLWRRFVGTETNVHPFRSEKTPTADVIITDNRRHEIYRVASADGKVKWRLPIKEPFHGPVLAEEHLLATTAAGVIVDIDLVTGNSERRTQLPQPAKVATTVGSRSQLVYQAGAQASLFVLGGKDMQCRETIYLAHRDGALVTSPVSVLGNVFIADNAGADYCLLHIYQGDAQAAGLKSIGEPMRLKGRVVTSPAVHGRRIAYVTDLGEIVVLEVDPVNKKQPVTVIGKGVALEQEPVAPYVVIDGTNLWVGSRRLINYEIQASLQQLAKKWTIYSGDTFLAPPQVFGNVLVHTRQRTGTEGVLVEATSAEGKRLWQLELGTPLAGLFPNESQGAIGVTRTGRTLRWEAGDRRSGVLTTFAPTGGGERPLRVEHGALLGKEQWVFHARQEDDQWLTHSAANQQAKLVPSGGLRSAFWKTPVPFLQGVLVPQKDGAIRLVRPDDSSDLVLPLFPMLQANATISWHRPTVLEADRKFFLAVNSNGNLFRVGVKEKPRPHLSVVLESKLKDQLISPLVSTENTAFIIARREAGDVFQAIDIATLKIAQEWPQTARLVWGPLAFENRVVAAFSDGHLVCYDDARQQRWIAELPPQVRAAEPIFTATEWLFPTADGRVLRLTPEKGEWAGELQAGEPLGIPLLAVGSQLLAATADGTLLVLPLAAGT